MFVNHLHRIACGLLLMMASMVLSAQADTPQQEANSPHEMVELVTEQLLGIVRRFNDGELDSEAYFAEFEQTLEPVVDFEYIARVVMGSYGDKATDEQISEFAKVFRRGLVRTYSRGIASYVDSSITLVPPQEDVGDKRRVTVRQNVRHQGSSHSLSYTMAKNRAGDWQLINLVLDGVNLGSSFRSQFAEAMRKYGGDLDQVIEHWLDDAS